MKWKNIASETGTFFVTATLANWRPLFLQEEARRILLADLDFYRRKYDGRIFAYVIMPEHYHLALDLNAPADLHPWLRDVQGHTANELARWLRAAGEPARGPIWKEQARAIPIITERVLRIKIDYLHANPVRRGLVAEPGEWAWSSWRNYDRDDETVFRVDRPDLPL